MQLYRKMFGISKSNVEIKESAKKCVPVCICLCVCRYVCENVLKNNATGKENGFSPVRNDGSPFCWPKIYVWATHSSCLFRLSSYTNFSNYAKKIFISYSRTPRLWFSTIYHLENL